MESFNERNGGPVLVRRNSLSFFNGYGENLASLPERSFREANVLLLLHDGEKSVREETDEDLLAELISKKKIITILIPKVETYHCQ